MIPHEPARRDGRRVKRTGSRATVGQDITCPTQIASGGRIRLRSERAAEAARLFGLDRRVVPPSDDDATAARDRAAPIAARGSASPPALPPPPPLRPGTITLISGASGAGKSTLLRATRAAHPDRRWIDLAEMTPSAAPDAPLVDCFADLPLRAALALLAQVGLGEAWTYLRTPAELSEGQRWRFRLALALHEAARAKDGSPVIACDEFAAVLDRVTAAVVAHRLRRAIDALPHAAAVVATSHEDLEPALAVDVVVRCDFGRVELDEVDGASEPPQGNPRERTARPGAAPRSGPPGRGLR